jgi:hypothetical protein
MVGCFAWTRLSVDSPKRNAAPMARRATIGPVRPDPRLAPRVRKARAQRARATMRVVS